jgi:tetratricopeptide (TPR) repeat protein
LLGGDLDKGLKLLNDVVALEPSNERNYVKRYRVFVRKRKFKEAFADLTTALELKPSYKAALAPRAKLGLQLGRCADAAADLSLLRQVDPKAAELRDEPAAVECAAALVRAAALEARGDWPAARDALGVALAHADASPELLLQRASLALKMRDLYECVADAGRAIKLAPESIAALALRGRAYYQVNTKKLPGLRLGKPTGPITRYIYRAFFQINLQGLLPGKISTGSKRDG